MTNPIFWVALSFLLLTISLTALIVAAIPLLQELTKTSRTIEKLADTLIRELPPILDAIRRTGVEINNLTEDMSSGIKSASQVVKQVDKSVSKVNIQAKKVQITTRSVFTGVKAAWQKLTNSKSQKRLSGQPNNANKALPEGSDQEITETYSPDYRHSNPNQEEHN
ncbi:MAG TPA: DUF948 domain-containing protein [Allocoleopsis sp.]